MNRLQQDDWAVGARRMAKPTEISASHAADTARKTPHRFFLPLHYEKSYAYPLLVWLHGPGGSESEISHVMPHISLRNYVGVAPRGTSKDVQASRIDRDAYTWNQKPESVDAALDNVMESVEQAKHRYNIASNRVFLVGNEVGGTMALRLALTAPHYFGGVISLGGPFPMSDQPLASIERSRSMPIMIAHCRDSQSYDSDAVCADLRLLHSAGMKVCLRQYPCGQEVTTKMLSDVNSWVMEQVVGPQQSLPKVDDPTHQRLEDHN